jgi:hypothetical protein
MTITLQATPLRCDVIVGCEDGLLGCIMGCGIPRQTPDSSDALSPVPLSLAHDAAATALDRMLRVATGDAMDLEAEDVIEAAAAAAAAAAATIAAAECADAGIFRAIRVHDAAIMCLGVMMCAMTLTNS